MRLAKEALFADLGYEPHAGPARHPPLNGALPRRRLRRALGQDDVRRDGGCRRGHGTGGAIDRLGGRADVRPRRPGVPRDRGRSCSSACSPTVDRRRRRPSGAFVLRNLAGGVQ